MLTASTEKITVRSDRAGKNACKGSIEVRVVGTSLTADNVNHVARLLARIRRVRIAVEAVYLPVQ